MKKFREQKLPNWRVATYALHLLNGAAASVHTEDVALKCHELAPDLFSWVRHEEYPDKDIVRSALMDARKEKNGALVKGRSGRGSGQAEAGGRRRAPDGWQLTEAGVKWIRDNEDALAEAIGEREPSKHRLIERRKLGRITDHSLFQTFCSSPESFKPALADIAEVMRCRVDADEHVWRERLETFRNLAHKLDAQDVLEFLKRCEAVLNKEYSP